MLDLRTGLLMPRDVRPQDGASSCKMFLARRLSCHIVVIIYMLSNGCKTQSFGRRQIESRQHSMWHKLSHNNLASAFFVARAQGFHILPPPYFKMPLHKWQVAHSCFPPLLLSFQGFVYWFWQTCAFCILYRLCLSSCRECLGPPKMCIAKLANLDLHTLPMPVLLLV